MDGIAPNSLLPLLPPTSTEAADRSTSGAAHSARRVAHDFEGLFVSLVLKEMRQTLEPGSLFAGDSADVYGGLFDMFLSKHLVDAGGFGVAKMVQQSLKPRETL